jgi:RimJ/RimL family protein N-acetyltransferase/tRNA A-37 threonylcarbamoyl transferase component Bud32
LRRYRDGGDVAAEAEVMRIVRDQGYPVPAVYSAEGTDMVMERLDGPTLADAVLGGSLSIEEGAVILADLHDRLRPTGYVHLDLHPFNVMVTEQGPFVIDWRNAGPGPADLDLAMSGLILGTVASDPGDPAAAPARALLEAFLRKVSGDPLAEMPEALKRRSRDPGLSGAEVALLPAAAKLVARHAVRIREVRDEDLEELFEHQREPESVQMAAFPARERDAFYAHWAKIRVDPTGTARVITCGTEVAGDVVCWDQEGQTLVGYWIGKRFWGRGIASRAVELFAAEMTRRPLRAFVAVHNAGSIRVLEKCGFRRIAGPTMAEDGIEEYLYELA